MGPSVGPEGSSQRTEAQTKRSTLSALSAALERRRAKPPRQRAVLEVARRCRLLEKQVPLFSRLTRRQLRMLLGKSEVVVYQPDQTIVQAGAEVDALLVVEQGRALHGSTGAESRRGQVVGAMEMLMGMQHRETVRAAERTVVLRISLRDAKPIVERCWGTRAEILKRRDLLMSVPLFSKVDEHSLLQLTTALRREVFPHGSAICTEGQFADCMHIIVAGNVVVHTRAHGRLTTLGPRAYFGEMGILVNQSWRTATVRAESDSRIDGSTECFRLHRRDVQHLLDSDSCAAALAEARAAYDQRAASRQSDRVGFMVDQFFDILATPVSSDGEACLQKRGVSQGGYTRLHMLVTKVLVSGLSDEEAEVSARNDWAEDIVSFEIGDRVNAALELAKTELRDLVSSDIQREGWGIIGEDRIDAHTFVGVCRDELAVQDSDLDDQVLADIFVRAESSVLCGAGLSGPQFASWLSNVCDDHEGSVRTPVSSAAVALRKASQSEITKCGWERAFSRFSTDGLGEVRFEEFAVLVQGVGADPIKFPRSVLRQVFRHLDSSRSGRISSAQVYNWIENTPMEQLMSIRSFKEGLLQLSQLWAEQIAVDVKSSDRDFRFLQWLFEAVTCVDGDGGDDGSKRRLRRLDELEEEGSPQNAEQNAEQRPVQQPVQRPVQQPGQRPGQQPRQPQQAVTSSSSVVVPDIVLTDTPQQEAEMSKRTTPPKVAPKYRAPLFVSPRRRTASPQRPEAKDLNPNRIFCSKYVLGERAWTSTCRSSMHNAAPPDDSPSRAEQASRQEDASAVAIGVSGESTSQDFALEHVQPVYVSSDPRDQWSTKHHPSSSRQARRTTGSGRLIGRAEHCNAPPPYAVELAVRPNSCSDRQGRTYVEFKNEGNLQRPATAGAARPATSKHVSLSVPTGRAPFSKRKSAVKDIVFTKTEGANMERAINHRPRPATAPVRRGAAERAGGDQAFQLNSAWLAAGAKEQGPRLFNEFDIAGIRERTRPASAARMHVVGVESRGPMRSGRPDTRPFSARPHSELMQQMIPIYGSPRLTRRQVEKLLECGGFQYGSQVGATLTEY